MRLEFGVRFLEFGYLHFSGNAKLCCAIFTRVAKRGAAGFRAELSHSSKIRDNCDRYSMRRRGIPTCFSCISAQAHPGCRSGSEARRCSGRRLPGGVVRWVASTADRGRLDYTGGGLLGAHFSRFHRTSGVRLSVKSFPESELSYAW